MSNIVAPDSVATQQLMKSTSNPPTEDEVIGIVASRIADQVDFDVARALFEPPTEQDHIDTLAKAFQEALHPVQDTPNPGLAQIGAHAQILRLLKLVRDPMMAAHLAALNPGLIWHLPEVAGVGL